MPEEETKPTPEEEGALTEELEESGEEIEEAPSKSAGEGEKLYAGKYKSPEELEKGYIELNKKLPELGRKANIAERLVERVMKEQNLTEEGALDYLNSLSKGELRDERMNLEDRGDEIARNEIKRLRWETSQDKLEREYPELKGSTIMDYLRQEFEQTGRDPLTLFREKYLPLIEEGKNIAYQNKELKRKAAPTVGSGEMPPRDEVGEAFLYAQKTGDWKPYLKLKKVI